MAGNNPDGQKNEKLCLIPGGNAVAGCVLANRHLNSIVCRPWPWLDRLLKSCIPPGDGVCRRPHPHSLAIIFARAWNRLQQNIVGISANHMRSLELFLKCKVLKRECLVSRIALGNLIAYKQGAIAWSYCRRACSCVARVSMKTLYTHHCLE